MAILERVSTLLRANLNDLLDRAEDPEKMVKQLLSDMQGQLVQVRTHVAVAMADEQKLKALCQQNEGKAEGWRRKARLPSSRETTSWRSRPWGAATVTPSWPRGF